MIKVFNLSKNFGQFNALKNINLEVNNGEILGLLGENGAGKSTFLRILSTMLKPSSGSAEGKLSKGMKQKVAVARAVIHDPSVILLDEPDAGLDFKASRIIFNFMQQCKSEGKSIIYSSHSLENIKNYSDKIAVIRRGEIIKTFSVSDFREKHTEREINEIILNWVCEEDEND